MLAASLMMLLLGGASQPEPWPLTRAESTNYGETSHYQDVVDFLDGLQKAGAPLSVQWIGTSTEGKRMPLAIIAYPPVATPLEARRTGKPIVYIQANIHAGEIEGKEAAQMMLRRFCREAVALRKGPVKGSLVDKMIFLIDPIYNIDGNEKFGPVARNRPEQDGPAMVGLRANGQNLDLNRDCIKAESPEMRAVLAEVYTKWDPDVVFDLHTTDGTRHGFELTYAPPENPNTAPEVLHYSRDVLLPAVRRDFKRLYGQELFDYGNAVRSGSSYRWETFGHEGRYVTNYAGLRNRIGILSEATTFIPFRDRVLATERFVSLCLEKIAREGAEVVHVTRSADRLMDDWAAAGPQLGVRFEMTARPGMESVPLEKPPGKHEKRPEAIVRILMPTFDRFRATKTARFPWAYLVPAAETQTIELLKRHGVVIDRLDAEWTGAYDQFMVQKANQANQPFQNHRLWTLDGQFQLQRTPWPAGSWLVRTGQPLGTLIFHILEPESTDGAAAWGFMGDFKDGSSYSIGKVYRPIHAVRERG